MTVVIAPSRSGRHPVDAPVAAVACGVAVLLGVSVPVAAGRASTAAALVGAVSVAALCSLGARRVLLAVVVVSIPFQLGTSLGYRDEAAAVGAIGGLGLSVTTAAVAGLWALWLMDLAVRADVPAPDLRGAVPFAAFTGAVALSVLHAEDGGLALFEVALLVESLLLLIVLRSWMQSDGRFVLGCVLAAGAAQAAFVVVGRIVPWVPGGRVDAVGPVGVRSGGTVGSPNTAAGFFAAVLVIALAVSLSPTPSGTSRAAAATVPLSAAALLLTASRGAWAGAAIGSSLVVWVLVGRGWCDAAKVVMGLALLLVAAVVAAGPISDRLTGDDGGAVAGRGVLAEMTADVIAAHPLTGVGANNLGPVLLDHPAALDDDTWVYTVHNKFLLVWAEAGPLALVAFTWFLVAALRAALAAARDIDVESAVVAIGVGAALVALTVQMLVEPFSSRPQVQLLVLLVALSRARTSASSPREVARARS